MLISTHSSDKIFLWPIERSRSKIFKNRRVEIFKKGKYNGTYTDIILFQRTLSPVTCTTKGKERSTQDTC